MLDEFAQILSEDDFLQELASFLGKQSRAKSIFEKEEREKVVIKNEWHSKPAYKGQINGVTYSNNISSALPSELALLKNEAAKKLFLLKLAQKQILAFKYENTISEKKKRLKKKMLNLKPPNQKDQL